MRCSCGHENDPNAGQCARCGQPLRRNALGRLWLDIAAAAGLLFSLLVVFLIDRAVGSKPPDNNTTTEIASTNGTTSVRALRLAVTPPEYDDMGKLLSSLGAGYRYTTISMDDLLDSSKLAQYDVVFVTCGLAPDNWLGARRGLTARDNIHRFTVRKDVVRKLNANLRSFVEHGGTLYASDWQFDLLKIAFPELIDSAAEGGGGVQTVTADVVDAGLRHAVGNTIELTFDKPSWKPAAFKGKDVAVLLRGAYEITGGGKRTGPLLVQIPFRGGNIIYTAFHNEKQNSDVELELLRHLVFTTVTAKVDAGVRSNLVRGGFSPVDRNLLSASTANQAISQTYKTDGGKALQFVLGFEDRGAELKLAIVGPDGTKMEKSGTATITIDVPRAAAGQWRSTITPLRVPYQNFPFTLTVGEK